MTPADGPPLSVLAAFGLDGPAVPLPGGQGTSWRVGHVVLKPGVDPAFQEWLGTDVSGIEQRGFRLPSVRRAVDGTWVVAGWGAQAVLPGAGVDNGSRDWHTVIAAARALHRATAALPRPSFLDARSDPWAEADRAVWGESPSEHAAGLEDLVLRLRAALGPLGPAQLIHGDLTTNVLMGPDHPPSIIDFSPYWRPAAYAEGIVMADALCWQGASPELSQQLGVPLAAVARGLLFRVLTTAAAARHRREGVLVKESRRYASVVDALGL